MPAEEKQPTCALVHALVLLRLVCLQLTKPRASSQLATHADDEPGLPQSLHLRHLQGHCVRCQKQPVFGI